MAWLDKRSGKWVGEVKLKGLPKFKRYFDSKKMAEAYEVHVNLHRTEPAAVVDGREMPTKGRSFREVAEQCWAAGGPRGVWHDGKDRTLRQRLDYAIDRIGDYAIDHITRRLVREKVTATLTKQTQGTINNYLSAISAVLTWAVNEEVIEHKPKLEMKTPKTRKVREPITFAEEDKIIAALEPEEHTAAVCVRFLVESGMRSGELLRRIRPEQIKDDHFELEPGQVKNNAPRLVYVRPDLCREMRAILATGAQPNGLQLLRIFQAAAKSGGIEKHVTIHGLRHTRNTRLYLAGVEKSIRMKLLGHTSKDVNDGYLHVPLEEQRRIAQKLEELRGERKVDATIVSLSDAKKSVG